jgi:hypothetical protein
LIILPSTATQSETFIAKKVTIGLTSNVAHKYYQGSLQFHLKWSQWVPTSSKTMEGAILPSKVQIILAFSHLICHFGVLKLKNYLSSCVKAQVG